MRMFRKHCSTEMEVILKSHKPPVHTVASALILQSIDWPWMSYIIKNFSGYTQM